MVEVKSLIICTNVFISIKPSQPQTELEITVSHQPFPGFAEQIQFARTNAKQKQLGAVKKGATK